MCKNNCVSMLDCFCCGVKTEFRTIITELLTGLIASAAIDLGIEFGCNFKDSNTIKAWLNEAMLSSGVSAACITLCSAIIRIANYKYAHNTENNREQVNKPLYFTIALTLSELISGSIAFGSGIFIEYLLEETITHQAIKNWEHSNAIPLALLAPAGITLAKTMFRLGIFKSVGCLVGKSCSTSNEEEVQPFALASINSTYT